MSDDDVAYQLGELMTEQEQQIDPRLERLALGELSDDELSALLRDAEQDEKLAEAVSLFRPLGADVQAKLTTTARASSSKVRRLPWVGAGVGVVLAAAAAVVLFSTAGVESIPQYTFKAEAGDAIWRSEAKPKSRTLREDSEMSIVSQPARIASGEIDGALWVLTADRAVRSPVAPEVSVNGAVRWLGTARALSAGQTGPVKFVAFVGRANAFPEPDERGGVTSGNGWQSFELSVEIQPRGAAP